jgi:hypothetical protein
MIIPPLLGFQYLPFSNATLYIDVMIFQDVDVRYTNSQAVMVLRSDILLSSMSQNRNQARLYHGVWQNLGLSMRDLGAKGKSLYISITSPFLPLI